MAEKPRFLTIELTGVELDGSRGIRGVQMQMMKVCRLRRGLLPRSDHPGRSRRQGFAFGFYIYLVKPRGVQPEDHRLILFGDLLITKLFTHLIGHLEALEGVDAPLRRAPPQTICSPDRVIRAIVLDVLAQ